MWVLVSCSPPLLCWLGLARCGLSSREISAGLDLEDYSFYVWDSLSISDLVNQGHTLLRYQNILTPRTADMATWTTVGGYQVPTANASVL